MTVSSPITQLGCFLIQHDGRPDGSLENGPMSSPPMRRLRAQEVHTMTDREPTRTVNLDGYGNPPLAWSRVHEQLSAGPFGMEIPFFLSTSGSDGRPHTAGIGPCWHDGDLYFVSGPGTRKSRHLAANPSCSVSCRLPGMDLVIEGEAQRVTDPATLETMAELYRDGGWPATVDGDAFTGPYSAPSAGPPPWYVYRLRAGSVVAVASEEPPGATRWDF